MGAVAVNLMAEPDTSSGYAVLDVETTGVSPSWNNRIVEIGIVQLSREGEIIDEWGTLVNPERDLGPQSIHSIQAADIMHAPLFAQVAGKVTELLQHRVLVAHNLPFDLMFLSAEFERTGRFVPIQPDLGVCTMRLAAQYLPNAPRSLAGCCAFAGISLRRHHDALEDARAAAELLAYYLHMADRPEPWSALFDQVRTQRWPDGGGEAAEPVRRGVSAIRDQHFLARIVDRLPRVPQSPEADSYLSVLDKALLDRHISVTEANSLVGIATRLGLDRTVLDGLHRNYLSTLAESAHEDGVVTENERKDLSHVAALLGLSSEDADKALALAAEAYARGQYAQHHGAGYVLNRGDLVVFTGQTSIPREELEARARAAGLRTHRSVTREVRLLVAADPDTHSGKARKAREYDIPIVTSDAFESLLVKVRTSSDTARDGRQDYAG